jgi:hypothetical protein
VLRGKAANVSADKKKLGTVHRSTIEIWCNYHTADSWGTTKKTLVFLWKRVYHIENKYRGACGEQAERK